MTNRYRVRFLVTLAVLTAFGGACQKSAPPPAQNASATAASRVRIGYQKYGVLLVLKARGNLDRALREQGVAVEWSEFPGGIQLMEALQAGRLDLGVVGEAPPVFGQAAGASIVYLAAEPPSPEGEAILVPKGSSIGTVAALKGKTVAVNKGSNAHYLLIRALEEAGVDYQDVTVAFIPPADARAAFESGKVDAWSIWDPFLASEQLATAPRVLRDGRGLTNNPGYYLATREFAESQPALVTAFLDQVKAIDVYVQDHSGDVADLLAPQIGIAREALLTALQRGRTGTAPLTDELVASQQRIADTFQKLNLIPKPIRVAEAVFRGHRVP